MLLRDAGSRFRPRGEAFGGKSGFPNFLNRGRNESCSIPIPFEEVEQYRKIMDPLGKMADDVFADACRMENVDLEYIAVSDTDQLLNADLTCRSVKAFECKVRSVFPAYVSLFGAKEMRLTIHQDGLLEPIHSIVKRYCINKMV